MTLFETPTDTVLRLILIVRYLCYNICYLWWKYCFQCARISSFIGIGNDSIRWKMWSINSLSLLSNLWLVIAIVYLFVSLLLLILLLVLLLLLLFVLWFLPLPLFLFFLEFVFSYFTIIMNDAIFVIVIF